MRLSRDSPRGRLLGGDVDAGFCGFPGVGFVEGDGEIFQWGGELGDFHIDAGEVVAWAGIGGAPFAGFFADDELPFVGVGHGKDGVAAGGDGGAADVEIGIGDEGGRFICAGAPTSPKGTRPPKILRPFMRGLEYAIFTDFPLESWHSALAGGLGLVP